MKHEPITTFVTTTVPTSVITIWKTGKYVVIVEARSPQDVRYYIGFFHRDLNNARSLWWEDGAILSTPLVKVPSPELSDEEKAEKLSPYVRQWTNWFNAKREEVWLEIQRPNSIEPHHVETKYARVPVGLGDKYVVLCARHGYRPWISGEWRVATRQDGMIRELDCSDTVIAAVRVLRHIQPIPGLG